MRFIKLALLITTLLIPFALSAKKDRKKKRKATPIEAVAPVIEEDLNVDTLVSVADSTFQQAVTDSLAILGVQVLTSCDSLPVSESESLSDLDLNPKFEDEGAIPASHLYPEWSSERVNPYGIRLENTEDSIRIDVSTFCYPLPTHYRVTSEFGFRRSRFHYGIDLKLNIGDSVVCAFDGMVRIAKTQKGGYGRYVVVRHNNGLETVYGHLNKLLVQEGQTVKAGELLGEGGNTGRSTGPHLHFEIRYLGQAINPRDVVDFADEKLCCHNNSLTLTKVNFEYIKEIEAIKYWTVRSGHTLSHIASKTGVSISRLCALNNIKRTSILRIGQRIRYN